MCESCQCSEKLEAVHGLLAEMLEIMEQRQAQWEETAVHLREMVEQQIETKDCISGCASRMQRSLDCIVEAAEDVNPFQYGRGR